MIDNTLEAKLNFKPYFLHYVYNQTYFSPECMKYYREAVGPQGRLNTNAFHLTCRVEEYGVRSKGKHRRNDNNVTFYDNINITFRLLHSAVQTSKV